MIVSLELMNAVIGYLGKRPYEEVYQLVTAIQKEAANQPKVEEQHGEQMDSESN